MKHSEVTRITNQIPTSPILPPPKPPIAPRAETITAAPTENGGNGLTSFSTADLERKLNNLRRIDHAERRRITDEIEWRNTAKKLTPESLATFTELRRLRSDERYAARLTAWSKENERDLGLAYAELDALQGGATGVVK